MRLKVLALVPVVMLLAATAWTSSAWAAGSITNYTAGLQPNSFPKRIVAGPDGNLWFINGYGGGPAIGRITPSGTITEYTVGLDADSDPGDIVTGPDGNLWFTDSSEAEAAIGRITPSGAITEFSEAHWEHGEPAELTEPAAIVSGPDGNLWFTDYSFRQNNPEPAIGRITPSGTITLFRLPLWSQPGVIVVGPDGNLWFTNWGKAPFRQSIGKITTSGEVTEYLVPEQEPVDIAAGSDGALWFTNLGGAIGKVTTGGVITEYSAGLQANAAPGEILAGPDGDLWFTDGGPYTSPSAEERDGRIGRITPSGTITEFGGHLAPGSITVGADGNLWVADEQHGLDRVSPSGQLTYFWLGLPEDRIGQVADVASGPGGDGVWFTAGGYNQNSEAASSIGELAPVTASSTPSPTVEVQVAGSGTGLVTSTPAGISCPGVCSSQFAPGTEVTLTETAGPGSSLLLGSVALADDDPCPDPVPAVLRSSSVCRFTVDGDALARVDFEPEAPAVPSRGIGGGAGSGGNGQVGGAAPPTSSGPSPVKPAKPKPPPKCRKGFKKQKVHGKAKCVKVERKGRR